MMPDIELKKRMITGLSGILAMLVLIIFGHMIGIYLMVATISLLMLYEFLRIALKLEDRAEKQNVIMGIAWIVLLVSFFFSDLSLELFLFSFTLIFIYFLYSAYRYTGEGLQAHFLEMVFSVFGMAYLVFMPLFMTLIRKASGGMHWLIFFFLVIWAGDTAAYFIGKKYGKRKLYEKISPNKTWEGAGAGLLGGLVVGILYKLLFFKACSWFGVLLTPLLVGAVAQIGDLCESFFKRAFGLKDSGNILPGHGGVLDRFDGVVFALPVMYGCVKYFV